MEVGICNLPSKFFAGNDMLVSPNTGFADTGHRRLLQGTDFCLKRLI